ncbi:hypothetical protein [Mycetohabitans sp. B46]|uniref:hypothetical protein n=1 Tax=Mycetohabitans sp. B46 TaxID=2772536 RepID=UPI00307DF149
MSYLNPLRLHFAGQFQANVSTVNNDAGHFNNATFLPSYQEMQSQTAANGWWNPSGDAAWRLLGCKVTSAWLPSGSVDSDDPVRKYLIADSNSRVSARLVDLDPYQQLVSEIWGLQMRITDVNGNTLMCGNFSPAPFLDIWDRATNESQGDQIAGAMYQSVLTNLEWGDVSNSNFLTALKNASSTQLSIKFNVDGFNMDFKSAEFACGRIVGTIGPSEKSEPRSIVIGRQFMADESSEKSQFFKPKGGINFFPAQIVKKSNDAGAIFLDLGNALSTSKPGGGINDLGDLTLSVLKPDGNPEVLGSVLSKGSKGYTDENWYPLTAGVVELPLTQAQMLAVSAAPLTLSSKDKKFSISEWKSGVFVRADRFVYRISPGARTQIPVYAIQWGRPLAGVKLSFAPDSSELQPDNSIDPSDIPPVATPLTALQFVDSETGETTPLSKDFVGNIVTNSEGVAILTLDASDPGMPRCFKSGCSIDGQVYGIRPAFADTQYNGPSNQWNFISILLWSDFKPAQPVTWTDLQPIFQQYANLYPIMSRFLNMANYDEVVKNASLLKLVFGLDPTDPNYMPVTRDLSPAKRAAILTWLDNPTFGSVAPALPSAQVLSAGTQPANPIQAGAEGGKAAASARRLSLR